MLWLGRPLQIKPPVREGAIPQVEIDEVLIGYTKIGSQGLEVGYRVFVQADGNGLLEVLDIGVPDSLHFRKIVMSSHNVTTFWASSNVILCFRLFSWLFASSHSKWISFIFTLYIY